MPRWIRLSFHCLCCLLPWGSLRADLLSDARSLYDESRYAEAEPLFAAVLAGAPDNRDALLHLGKLAAKRQDRATAVDYLKHAVALNPDDAELQFEYGAACSFYAATLGTSIRAAWHARNGRIAMEKSVKMAPENLIYRQGLLEFYCSAPMIVGGSMAKAKAQAVAISALDVNQGAFAKANLQLVEKDYAGALITLTSVLERAPDNYFALFQFGRTAAQSGERLADGLVALRRCLELKTPDKGAQPAYVWWHIGKILTQQGDRAAARLALETARQLAPFDSRIAKALAELNRQA